MSKNDKQEPKKDDERKSPAPADEQAVRDAHYAEKGVDEEGSAPESED